MGLVVDAQRQTTDVLIRDAQRFSGLPQAVVMLPALHPGGLPRQRGADAALSALSPGAAGHRSSEDTQAQSRCQGRA